MSFGEDLTYEKASWVLLELGKLSRDGTTSLLKIARVTTWNLTPSGLSTLLQRNANLMGNPEGPTPQLLYMGTYPCSLMAYHTNVSSSTLFWQAQRPYSRGPWHSYMFRLTHHGQLPT